MDEHPYPVGLRLNQTARLVGVEFDRALMAAGGSLPVWLVLLSLVGGRPATQRELAALIGIAEATLSHHLGAMERDGLVVRARNERNRRIHDVIATDAGTALFQRLREAAVAFDARLNQGLDPEDQAHLAGLLDRVRANLGEPPQTTPPWAGVGPAALAAQGDGLHHPEPTPTQGPTHD
jgi:MarR family transcriptional regulator for hemolysin